MTSRTREEPSRENNARLEQGQPHTTGARHPHSGRTFEWTPEIWRAWTEKKSQLIEAHFVAQTEAVFALLQKGRPRLVLEAGCGYGRMTGLIASRMQGSSIIAIDL